MKHRSHWALRPALTALAFAALATGAAAQVTAQQQSAIKANCRSDFMSKCSGVTPGGKDALACLQKNVAGLSAGCKTAVSATLPPPAPAAAAKPAEPSPAPAPPPPAPATAAAPAAPAPATAAMTAAPPPKPVIVTPPKAAKPVAAAAATAAPTAQQQSAMRSACRNDFMAKCSGVQPGGKEALACLQKNVSTLSASCKQVVSATMGGAPSTATAAPAAAPTATVATAPAAGPTPEQMKALKFTCRGDFQRNCKGVAPGGQEAFLCLQRNAARLTPNCKTSLADIAQSMPEGAAATPAAATTTEVTVERRRLPPGITPAGRVIRRVMERNR